MHGSGSRSGASARREYGPEPRRPNRSAKGSEERGGGGGDAEPGALHAVLYRDHEHLAHEPEAETEEEQAGRRVSR